MLDGILFRQSFPWVVHHGGRHVLDDDTFLAVVVDYLVLVVAVVVHVVREYLVVLLVDHLRLQLVLFVS